MASKELKVNRIEAIEGEKIVKNMIRKTFVIQVRYVLEDGTTEMGTISRQRKKDVVAELAKLPREPKSMMACYRDGEYWGTSETFSLFG